MTRLGVFHKVESMTIMLHTQPGPNRPCFAKKKNFENSNPPIQNTLAPSSQIDIETTERTGFLPPRFPPPPPPTTTQPQRIPTSGDGHHFRALSGTLRTLKADTPPKSLSLSLSKCFFFKYLQQSSRANSNICHKKVQLHSLLQPIILLPYMLYYFDDRKRSNYRGS